MLIVDLIGYAGDSALVLVYLCLVAGKCCGQGAFYNSGKLFGYGSVALNGIAYKSLPMVGLGLVFCFLAVIALVRHWKFIVVRDE